MGKLSAVLLASAVSTALALPAHGQAFCGLGFLDPDANSLYSQANGVSGDGLTVVGVSQGQAFRWRMAAPSFLQPLGFIPFGSSSLANAASHDGSVVVGSSDMRAFRWDSVSGMVSLGLLQGNSGFSAATGVSADGSVVVGVSNGQGFRWTSGTGMVSLDPLPSFPNKGDHATAVSGDGLVAVGRAGCCEGGGVVSIRWPDGGSLGESLGDLPGTDPTSPWGVAAGISADGLAIVGGGGAPSLAYRWVGGQMSALAPSSLPPPSGINSSCGLDASGDGSVVVGTASDPPGDSTECPVNSVIAGRAFVWTDPDGIRSVESALTGLGLGNELLNWRLESATSVSDDGNIIVGTGTHDGQKEGWVAALAGTPFSSCPGARGGEVPLFRLATFYAVLRESHGFLWHPSKGPIPIDPDPPPELDPAAQGLVRWAAGSAGPRAAETLWTVRSETAAGEAELRLLRHDGRSWSADWISRGPGTALLSSRGFDVAHEGHSGDAIAVYGSGAGTPRFRTFRAGEWSDEQALPIREATAAVAHIEDGTVQWIELAQRPGSDEIALAYVDDLGHLVAWIWDGERWLASSATLLTDRLAPRTKPRGWPRRSPAEAGGRPFDIAYESLSGALLAAWSHDPRAGFSYARRPEGGPWSEPVRQPLPGVRADFVDLAPEPTSNLVAGAFVNAAGPEGARPRRRGGVALSMWDSTRWRHDASFAASRSRLSGTPLSAAPGALAWSATSRVALFATAGPAPGTLAWARWSEESGWSTQPSVVLPSDGAVRSILLASSIDAGGLLGVLSDARARLHGLSYDGRDGLRLLSERPLAEGLGSPDELPFALALAAESALLVGDPAAARRRDANVRAGRTAELLSFALVPRGGGQRVAMSSFLVDGLDRGALGDAALIVDENANGTIDAGETITVGGVGRANASGQLVFFEPFDVTAPTHYVLQSTLSPMGRKARVTVSLSASALVADGTSARGGAERHLRVGGGLRAGDALPGRAPGRDR